MSPRDSLHGIRWLHGLLQFAFYAVAVLAVLNAVWALVSLPLWYPGAPRLPTPALITLPAAACTNVVSSADAAGHQHEIEDLRGVLTMRLFNPWHAWLVVVLMIESLVLWAALLGVLYRIVGSIRDRDVFNVTNVRRLRWLGSLMIVDTVNNLLVAAAVAHLVTRGVTAGGAPVGFDWQAEFDWTAFFGAWIVLILSEVFRQGAEMRDDQALTV